MSAERLLQISMAILLTLGTLLRSPGQKDWLLPLFVLVAAGVSIYVTDAKKWIRLNHRLATAIALLSVGIPLRNFFTLDSAAQLLTIARLLTYLQLILLFQEKGPRLYWQLFTLSVLQVVVGAALNVSVVFGLLLTLYMFVGLFALTTFYMYREQLRTAGEPQQGGSANFAADGAAANGQPRAFGAMSPAAFSSGPSRRVPAHVGRRAWQQASLLGAGSLLVTAVLFVAAPRTGKSDWTANAEAGANPITGFSPTVQLGDLGTISQNSQPVMRVKLLDESGAPLALVDQPLFRGTLLNYYVRGGWSYRAIRPAVRTRQQQLVRVEDDRRYVRQEITIEPLNEPILFAIYPPLRLEQRTRVQWEPTRLRLYRLQRQTEERFRYVLGTTGIYKGKQWPLTPQFDALDGPESGLPQLASGNEDLAGEVKAVADQVLAETDVLAENRYARINALLGFFRDSGKFEYTLEGQSRDPNVDPIVDFLRTNRRGHCEYFATALCLMLRSQGIPARVVAGFYGDWNPLTQDYQVRQLHAHTWVEAYLEAEQVPQELLRPDVELGRGGWLTLDPTPGVVVDQAARQGFFAPLANFFDYAQIMWNVYVVGLNQSFQYETIYEPVRQWIVSIGRDVPDGIAAAANNFWMWLMADWLGWRGALTLAVSGALVAAGLRGVQWVRQWRVRRRLHRRLGRSPRGTVVEFYRRLEELLAQRGLFRSPGQTPHEFAASIAPHVALLSRQAAPAGAAAADLSPRRFGELPRQIVDAFYRVRFGGQALDPHERQGVEKALAELEKTIR